MPGSVPGIHVFAYPRRGWHRKSGLPDFRIKIVLTCGDEPAHDGLVA